MYISIPKYEDEDEDEDEYEYEDKYEVKPKKAKISSPNFLKLTTKREISGIPISTTSITNNKIYLSSNRNNEIIFTRVFSKPTNLKNLIEQFNKTNTKIFRLVFKDNQFSYKEYTNFRLRLIRAARIESKITKTEHTHIGDIYGYIILNDNTIDESFHTLIVNNINFNDFLFCDTMGNYFYLDYVSFATSNKSEIDVFECFKTYLKTTLKLELYKGFYIKSLEDVKRFKREFDDKPEHQAYYPQSLTTGGKRILKKY
jgi:hypothetical protein